MGRISVAENYISFDGQLQLYSGIYYKNLLLTINFSIPNRCYTVNCGNLDNKIASAKWSGLPTTGWAGKAYISFYTDMGCQGSQESTQLPHNGGIREFPIKQVNGNISSFMVRSESRITRHGIADVCSWTGVDVEGGSVSEADNQEYSVLND